MRISATYDESRGHILYGGRGLRYPGIASAADIVLPANAPGMEISGTENIGSITGAHLGRTIELVFSGSLSVIHGTSIKLADGTNFVTAPGSRRTLRGGEDGVWREIARHYQ